MAFVSHPNHAEYDLEVGRIVGMRIIDHVDPRTLEAGVRFLHAEATQESLEGRSSATDDIDQKTAVDAVVIERSMGASQDLVVHVYGPVGSPLVRRYLLSHAVYLMREDAALFDFASRRSSAESPGWNASPDGGHRAVRLAVMRELEALRVENARLRGLLQVPPPQSEMTCLKTTAGPLANQRPPSRSTAPPTRPQTRQGGATTSDATGKPPTATDRTGSASAASPPGPISGGGEGAASDSELPLHSPLSWERESAAVLNGRSRYDPYKQRLPPSSRLDNITQARMVARLHDQSVDLKERRRHENEQMVMRELGLHERRVLTISDQEDMARRLHDQTIAHAQQKLGKLKETYLSRPPSRSLSPQIQKESAIRMHDAAMDHARKTHEKLFQTYVAAMELEKKKLTVDEQHAMADRLSKRAVQANA